MKADRWRQVEQLYDAALELPAGERAKFVRDACAGDEDLRRELSGLLDAEQRVGDFMESPALDLAARTVAREGTAAEQPSFVGRELGPYRIEKLLGAGGMGEVYLAEDAKLKRKVALKILPPQFVSDPEHVRRFEREARAVSALNHPNLITIYDIGASDGVHFIATEFVAGRTVRDLIADGLRMKDALAIATQVAEALSAAHQAGVLHRDIKPENVMVRPDGYVKVLDFGLAKLTERGTADGANLSSQTQPGLLMGTLAYMSPEQAAGDAVDERTDIWSLGIMLYEMMTGSSPLKGANRAETLGAILSKEPLSVTEGNPVLPAGLDHILGKALEKDRELRYQTASDFRADLKRLKRELDSSPSLSGGSVAAPARKQWAGARPVRSRPRRALLLGAALLLVSLVGGLLLLKNRLDAKATAGPNWSRALSVQLTTKEGSELFCSLSPDGKSFVYVSDEAGNADIFLQRVGGKNPTNLTRDSAEDETTPAFSPDGNLIAFHSEREPAGLYVMEATGENPRRLSDGGYHPSWSPDGKEIVVGAEWIGVHTNKNITPSPLWVIEVTTGAKRLLIEGDAAQPSWSPGGGRVAYWYWSAEGRGDLATVPAAGGRPVRLTSEDSAEWNPVWSPDGKFIYFASDRGGSMNFWRVAVDEKTGEALGPPEAVPTPSRYAFNISFSRDGKTLAYVRYESIANLQAVAFDSSAGRVTGEPFWVTRGYTGISNPQLSPDGARYVARWPHASQEDIALFDRDGSNWRTLTDDKFQDRRPRWFPDGQRIAFSSDRGGSSQIWSISADGTGLRRLTSAAGNGASSPVLSPDGGRLAYLQLGDDGTAPYVLDLGKERPGQGAERLPPVPAFRGYLSPNDWSPDGDKLIGTLVDENRNDAGIAAYSLSSGSYQKLTDFGSYPSWLRDNRRFIFIRKSTIYLGDAQGGKAQAIFSPSSYAIQHPAISADNRTIFFRFLQVEADIWLLRLE
ncbi:MAG TPA: protein kinase [Pyrinomonadaceae bacterium]|nr:protein kinase [Pyrinomonadaceae bacterium]